MIEESLSRAVDHFADALKFAREAQREALRGRTGEVEKFAELASQAAQDGLGALAPVDA